VVILAAGFGTRLQSVIDDRPKVLAEVNGRPFLTYTLDQLFGEGFTNITVCTGHRGDQFKELLGGYPLKYSHEDIPYGTGSTLRHAWDFLEETSLIINGDTYNEVDYESLLRFHFWNGWQFTNVVTESFNNRNAAYVIVNKAGRLIGYEEKPAGANVGMASAGIYLINKRLIRLIPEGVPYSIERDFVPNLLQIPILNILLGGFISSKPFFDMGTPETLNETAEYLRSKK
jgi:NDP-sugar pyrophosphorylase family protein